MNNNNTDPTPCPSPTWEGSSETYAPIPIILGSVQTHWALRHYLCTACLPDACDSKPTKRQEISEFWCAENHAEVIKRMMAGKYASFEPLSASC